MTWKRCTGCTRAIAVTAFSCEYCGQLCDDVMEFLPRDNDRPSASPIDTFEPASGHETSDFAAEPARTPFEWESFPGASTADTPASGTQTTPGPFSGPVQAASGGVPADSPAGPFAEADFPAETAIDGDLFAEARSYDTDLSSEARSAHRDLSAGARSAKADGAGDYAFAFLDEEPAPGDDQAPLPLDNPAPAAPIASSAPGQAAAPRAGMRPRQLAMVGGGVLAAGALMFTILGMRGAASPEPATTPAPARRAPAKAPAKPPAAAKATPGPAVNTVTVDADAPRWSRATDGRWVSAGRQTAAFEVAATGRVHVWMRDVTPVLVVRCEKGQAEAFVYTQSAARMEPQDGDHTVQVSFDGASPASQRWPDSVEHDALFARNPHEFTRQLTQARTLQFGFTPHNADAVIATFALEGLEPLLASAKQCGWK